MVSMPFEAWFLRDLLPWEDSLSSVHVLRM